MAIGQAFPDGFVRRPWTTRTQSEEEFMSHQKVGTSGLLLESTRSEVPGKSPEHFGEVQGNSGKPSDLPATLGKSDSLPSLS